jgi:hypothetical protein
MGIGVVFRLKCDMLFARCDIAGKQPDIENLNIIKYDLKRREEKPA